MGQKINPIGLRLGINRGWDSTWFAKKKDFGKYLIDSHMLLTRAPLSPKTSFDLHVLGMPPAFVLSHNQTLKLSKI